MDPCARCGRTLLEVRADVGVGALRGSAPLCPVPACPLVQRVSGLASIAPRGLDLAGPTPPSVFVGRHGYPEVAAGPLLSPDPDADASRLADPARWSGLAIEEILALRTRLVRSRSRVDARRPGSADRVLEAAREIALSARPVDAEVTLARNGPFRLAPSLDGVASPMGPGVDATDARVVSSPSVPRRVDALVSDTDLRAGEALVDLYESGVPLDHAERLLSIGLLGESSRRRLVPTRWSITATDDVVGRALAERVRRLQETGTCVASAAELHGNRFHVVLVPGPWSFEMHEAWEVFEEGARRVAVASDAEGHRGRSDYASSITGAYYAARLAVLEHLEKVAKRQAAALVLREITEDYFAPLGVWVIREGVRKAMAGKPLEFGGPEDVLRHLGRRLRFPGAFPPLATLVRKARQRRLDDFATGDRRVPQP